MATLHRLIWAAAGLASWISEGGLPIDIGLIGGGYLMTLVRDSIDAWIASQLSQEVNDPTLKTGVLW